MQTIFVDARVKFNRQFPFKKEKRNEAFEVMSEVGDSKGFNLFFSRHEFYNKRSKSLKKAWTFKDGNWKIVKSKGLELCYYHGFTKNITTESRKIQEKINIPILNHMELEQVCDDKVLTYNIFPDLVPKTFLVNDFYEMHRVLHYVKTDRVVIKPRDGSFGRGVIIRKKKELANGIKKNTIIQEFIDTRNPYSKLKRPNDMRIVVIDGKINHAYIRMAAPGSFVANMTKGAKKLFIKREDIPSSIVRRVKLVDNLFQHYGPRIYSADFLVDQDNKPWLVELNSKPGMLFYEGAEKIRHKYFCNVFDCMQNLI